MNVLRKLFDKVDMIVTPTTAITAPKIRMGELDYGSLDCTTSGRSAQYAFLVNLCGIPAITCPIGYDQNGLPIGIQFQAKWWNEAILLRIANLVEGLFASERKALRQF
jgi:Asp-tRNA(Asn)/Glu-tRNA(Gln) amidotransferase A subunit family amidase